MTRARLGALALLPVLLAACDGTDIQPGVFDPYDRSRTFSVTGYLDPREPVQTIRVEPVRATPDAPVSAQDALRSAPDVVTVAAGDTTRWSRAVEQLADGSYATLYTAGFRPSPGLEYELVLERGDGARATARAEVPGSDVVLAFEAPTPTDAGAPGTLAWTDGIGYVFALESLILIYRTAPDADFPGSFSLLGRDDLYTLSDDRRSVTVDFEALYARVAALSPSGTVVFDGIEVSALVTSESWRLAETAQEAYGQSNVEGDGVGLFGALGRSGLLWQPDAAALEAIGFVVP